MSRDKNKTRIQKYGAGLRRFSVMLAALTMTGVPVIPAGAAEPVKVPAQARAMSAAELYVLYRNKTWQWPDGAGRMQEKDRTFIGWSGSGNDTRWAEGRWVLSDTGLMCLKAEWHGVQTKQANKTCFRHRIYEDTIYQKKEPSGSWYVFKHAKAADSDEFKKLIAEDTVSAQLAKLQPFTQQADAKQQPFSAQAPNGTN
ncbi:DUF995 domain-containing protein [Pseudochrobactrum sp. B5]|uniref:DUF995 domain-containing protein n=1 Tax=Pseudochrobactrum sp. B5 TaxID=1289478 RepID=UPI0009535737|nr:DUF995 domain-containing protein [Pseudochrobactrum sp. B5]